MNCFSMDNFLKKLKVNKQSHIPNTWAPKNYNFNFRMGINIKKIQKFCCINVEVGWGDIPEAH